MSKKKIKHSLSCVIKAAREMKCENLHHKKSHRHEIGLVCPAEYELYRQIDEVEKYMTAALETKEQ